MNEVTKLYENANKYKVLNCPAYNDMPNMYDEIYGYCDNEHGIDLNKCMCENITDCVVKQVIEKCRAKKLDIYNPSIGNEHYAMANSVLSTQILQLFDIEEINK